MSTVNDAANKQIKTQWLMVILHLDGAGFLSKLGKEKIIYSIK